MAAARPSGGDYMRMWTRVLAEDDYLTEPPGPPGPPRLPSRRKLQLGGLFDAFCFLGPDDVHGFFRADSGGGGALVAAVEAFFARKYAIDPDFWTDFGTVPSTGPSTTPNTVPGPDGSRRPLDLTDREDALLWEARRKEFVRFYTVRAGGSYSLGCHDEWNIFVRLNKARAAHPAYGPGELIGLLRRTGPLDGRERAGDLPRLRGHGQGHVARGTDGGCAGHQAAGAPHRPKARPSAEGGGPSGRARTGRCLLRPAERTVRP
ncbi:hypothetical protein [Streptomyces adelaidensis]|uniref:hypothetical protein n=1 Tax=Streptomyces adelaidensis TaxID=2796465 RepID=UPI001907D195|nr:hypothetical protein [Streptomyces adelaidensis]